MSAAKATNLRLAELPPRVQAALRRGEIVAISGDEGKVAELVPMVLPKRKLGTMLGSVQGDTLSPTDEPWEAMQE